uniref:HDC09514 n=1 Tax=Drosophila melanogaster TaxID=7227 RepID=Q6ILE8_DROME|nr:TPA_inf: HDC09514 [Drosophila melanogaster]
MKKRACGTCDFYECYNNHWGFLFSMLPRCGCGCCCDIEGECVCRKRHPDERINYRKAKHHDMDTRRILAVEAPLVQIDSTPLGLRLQLELLQLPPPKTPLCPD